MTIKDLNEQTVVVKAQNPNTSVQSDTFTQKANASYDVAQSVDQSVSYQTIYTNDSGSGRTDWTDTWTVPETGVYRLYMDMDGGEQTRLSIKVDEEIVENSPWDEISVTSLTSTRVLYAGTKISFIADYVRYNSNRYTVNVRKMNGTVNVNVAQDSYSAYPSPTALWNNNQHTGSSYSKTYTANQNRAITLTLTTPSSVSKMYAKIDGKTIVEKQNVSSITFDGMLKTGQTLNVGFENDSSVTGTFSLTDTRRLYSGTIGDSDNNPRYHTWPSLPPKFTVS